MTAFARRLARMARRFRCFTGTGALPRWGMTFAEALVMIVVAGSLMLPVVGTLQSGVDRTTAYVHQDRMRTIAQASMTEILAGSAYARTPVVDFTATVSWPINDPEPVATYVMDVETLEGITLATLTSTIKGDFAGNEALLGSQPANLKTVVITVTHVPDPGDTGVEPAQVRLFSMVTTPRSFNPNRIYIADKDNICVYAVDPLTKNVVETFDLPYDKNFTKSRSQNDLYRPGNIAVHPNGDWVLTQRKNSLLVTDVGLFSPTRRSSVEVYATSTAQTFLENPTDNEKIRKDRGVAFRPDGRYCYVTSHGPTGYSGLSIYAVPETMNASFPLVRFLPVTTMKYTDLQVGEDGYLYLGDYDYASLCFRRLNMFASQARVVLEDYKLPGWSTNAIAACTSRDGRTVYSVWKGPYIASSSSDNPDDWGSALVGWSPALGAEDIQDLQVSGDNRVLLATSKQGGNKARIYALPTELKGSTINPYGSPNAIAFPGNADVTNQAILSPAMNEVWVDRKGAGEIYALDTPGLLAGSYTTAVPADRTVIFIPSGDAGCVAARMSEMVAVACDGPAKTVEFIDPWSKHHYENLSRKLPYAVTPSHLAFDGSGSRLSVCYNASSTLPTDIDVFNIDNPPVAIDPENWGPTIARRPTHHIFFQKGGFLIQKYGNSLAANGYVSFDASGTKQADIKFPLTASMSDVIPLNDGGALVLVTDFVASWTRLDRIGSDAKLLAAWDSRFDNFPPNGATQMAISADDGLLVLYVPNSDSPGIGQLWQFFDMRTNNFGPLTHQKGFITDFRLSERSFAGGVPSAQRMTGTGIKLRETFTCNDSVPNMASYPANFAYTTANKYAGNAGETRSSRFFGYLRIPTPVQTLGLWNRDASQVFIGTTPTSILGTILDPYTSGSSATAPFSFSDAASRWIQLNHSSDNPQSDMALFFSPNSGETSTTGTQDYTVNGVTALGPNTADWKRVPAEYTSPLRFTPQYLYSLQNHHNYSPNTNLRVFMCFSRDVASPTLYVFNAPYGGFGVQPFGGSLYIPSFSLTPYSAKGMAITPDGQRLVIAATNPNKIHLLDISMPATSTYMTEVGTIDLPQPPACIAARTFNRIISQKDVYDVVATFTVEPPTGSNIAAVATNGIYLLGGTAANQTDPLATIYRFNPADNTIVQMPKYLAKKVKDPAVVAYDDELLVFNGNEVSPTGWVQKYDPLSNLLVTSVDPPSEYPTGLSHRWLFDEGTSTIAADSIGGQNGTFAGSAAWTAGKHGAAVQLDGTGGTKVNVSSNSSLNLTSPFTVALWVKPTELPNTWEAIIGKLYLISNYAFSIWTNSGNGSSADLEIWYGSSNQLTISNFFSINSWVHIAVTYNGSTLVVYKNGIQVSSTSKSTPSTNTAVMAFGSRRDTDNTNNFEGLIDDVQFFSRALSASEIPLVKAGLAPNFAGTFMSKTVADDNATVMARYGHAGCMTPYGPILSGGFAPTSATSSVQVYWPHAVAAGAPGREKAPDGCIGWYTFDDLPGNVAVDSSGNRYDGVLNNMNSAECCVAGRKNNCLEFDGIDDNVTISSLTGNLTTICFWIREQVAGPVDWSGPFIQTSNDTTGFQFRCSGWAPGYYSLKIGGTEYPTTIPDTDQTWKHVALVKDGTATKIYYNGVLNKTIAAVWTTAGSVRLGSNGNNDLWWNGKLDDLMMFNRTLTAAEVFQIAMTERPALVRLKFDETSGYTAADSSGNEHHATLSNFSVPSCWVAGQKNGCLDFMPSTSSVASIPDNTLWNLSGDFTICAWVNYDTFNINWWEAAIAGHDEGGGSKSKWIFSYDPGVTKGTLFHIQYTTGGGPEIRGNAWTAVSGTWYFLAVTRTGTTYQFYRDGVPDGTVTDASVIPDAAAPLTIGKAEGAVSFDGKIDDVRIYKYALSASEIQAVKNSTDVNYWGICRDLPPMPGSRVNHSLVWHKDKLYRVGGSDGSNILTTVDRYDPVSNTWATLTAASDADELTDSAALFKRQYAGACSFGDEIFLFGGENPAGTRLSTAAAWNPATKAVRKLMDIPSQTAWGITSGSGAMTKGINAVPCGPFIYLFGGSNAAANGTSKQILRYRP